MTIYCIDFSEFIGPRNLNILQFLEFYRFYKYLPLKCFILKGSFTWKGKFCHHLLTLVSFVSPVWQNKFFIQWKSVGTKKKIFGWTIPLGLSLSFSNYAFGHIWQLLRLRLTSLGWRQLKSHNLFPGLILKISFSFPMQWNAVYSD